jgi:hypothetical protein
MKVRELLSDESKWTKGSVARDFEGHFLLNPLDGRACSWCLVGALCYCYSVFDNGPSIKVIDRLGVRSLSKWNDAPERTFAEVKALVEELDI